MARKKNRAIPISNIPLMHKLDALHEQLVNQVRDHARVKEGHTSHIWVKNMTKSPKVRIRDR
jgi:hypothetical protein